MTLKEFNELDKAAAAEQLFSCCGSDKWVSVLMQDFPFASEQDLVQHATDTWYAECGEVDWLESFTHHPKIGDMNSMKEKFAGKEQAAVAGASEDILQSLVGANKKYEEKYGFIFIVCATGKSAEEMLRLVNERLLNTRAEELDIAMGEQAKITITRFKKIFTEADWRSLKASQLTTHVLDTSIGKPGEGITIKLLKNGNNGRQVIAQGVTNADGRIADLLPPGRILPAGDYKMSFGTGDYFSKQHINWFYPVVGIRFVIADDAHYHIPLLISPFGYSTYRGS